MSSRRRLLDSVFKLVAPAVDVDHRPPPVEIAAGVWSLDRRLRMPGGPLLPSRTTIVRLDGGGLALISAPPAHDETFAAIDALGRVEAIVAPNSFHHLYAGDSARRYPEATLYLAPGLQERVAGLPRGIDLATATPAPEIERIVLGPVRGISEVFLFHRPSRTLVLSDVAFNLVNVARTFDRIAWRAMGVPPRLGPSRTARLMLLNDRTAARAALSGILAWPFERILVAHGEPVRHDARAQFERGFAAYL